MDKEYILTRGYKSDISFVCPACRDKTNIQVDVPEPYWQADRASDMVAEDDIDVECGECGEGFFAHVVNSGGHCDIAIHDHPTVEVDAGHAYYDGPDSDDYDEPEPPENAHSVFLDSHHETQEMLTLDALRSNGSSMMNRMVFAHQIAAMEAFLADTVIIEVTSKPDAMKQLLTEDKELLKEKYDLAQIAAEPGIVRRKVLEHLRKKIMYHNLERVDILYRTVFRMHIFNFLTQDETATLKQAIEYRHDCVHRNGRTQDGEKLTVFTPEYVANIAAIAYKLVDAIERERVIGGFNAAIAAIAAKRSPPPQTGP